MATPTLTADKLQTSVLGRIVALAGVFGTVGALLVVKFVNPANSNVFPQCLLHAFTGLNCPACGATRGMHALLNGDVMSALDYNLLLVVFVPLMLYGFSALLSLGIRGRGLTLPRFFSHTVLGLLVVTLAFGVLRNLPFYPFTILAP